MTDDLVEKVAEAIYENNQRAFAPVSVRLLYLEAARAALSAIEEAGWCVVPAAELQSIVDICQSGNTDKSNVDMIHHNVVLMLSARPRITGETT